MKYLKGSLSSQPVCEQPPLLQSWTVQRGGLVHVEVFDVAGRLWVLTASTDGAASLWTKDGDHVGCFGRQGLWDITEPTDHQKSGLSESEYYAVE